MWNSSSLKIFKLNSSSLNGTQVLGKKKYKSHFPITQLSKNRVSKHEHIPKWFRTGGILLESLLKMSILPFWPRLRTSLGIYYSIGGRTWSLCSMPSSIFNLPNDHLHELAQQHFHLEYMNCEVKRPFSTLRKRSRIKRQNWTH